VAVIFKFANSIMLMRINLKVLLSLSIYPGLKPMYQLYWAAGTGAFVTHVALHEAGANYRLVEVDYANSGHRGDAFLELNPMGQLPTLVLPDGVVITESIAIVLCLAEKFPAAKLLPEFGTSDRAIAIRWLVFMSANTYPAILRHYYSDRFTVNPEQRSGVVDSARNELDRNFDILETVLQNQPNLAGQLKSIVDTYLLMVAFWHPDVTGLLDRCPNIKRVIDDVRARPVVQEVWQRNFPE
jgi:glutathione S-transferase